MNRRVAAAVCGLVLAFAGTQVLARALTVVSEAPLAERSAYRQTFRSRITGRDYQIRVWRPVDAPAGTRGPVLYVLDAEADAGQAAALARQQGPAWIVAIAPGDDPGGKGQRYNADYLRREFLHQGLDIPAQGNNDRRVLAAGDGAGFQRFLLEELKPLIEQRHPEAGPETALLGSGMAGTFVLNVAVEKPDAFSLYAAQDPALDAALAQRLSRPGPKAAEKSWSVKLLISWYTADHMWTDLERPVGQALVDRDYAARWRNNLTWSDFVTDALVMLRR